MISVILPYNKDRGYLHEAIASVEAQTYKDYELVLHQGDASFTHNMNMALKRANGEYVKILSEDDQLTPDSLEILISQIAMYDFVYADAENFGDIGGWPKRSHDKTVTLESMLIGNGIHGGGVLYKTEILRAVGGFDEALWAAEEYDLHLKLIKAGYKHSHVEGIVYRYRLHDRNKCAMRSSGPRQRIAKKELIDRIKQRYR